MRNDAQHGNPIRGRRALGARRTALTAFLLLLATTGRAAGGPAEPPTEEVRLSPARPPWPRFAPWAAPSDVALPPGFTALAGTASGARVLVADVTGDGLLDAWAPIQDGQVHWLPLSRPVVLPVTTAQGIEPRELAWRVASDAKSLASRAIPAPEVPWSWPADWGPVDEEENTRLRDESATSRQAAFRALARLNDLRMRNGLPPGRLAPDRCADAFLHALYVARTGDFAHTQRPGRWASAGGAASGLRSGLTKSPDPVASHYFTILHRMLVFRRETPEFGFGAAGSVTVLDGSAYDADLPWSEAGECIPGPFAEGIPLVARDELPRPHADVIQVGRNGVIGGFPITIHVGRKYDEAIPAVDSGLVSLGKPAAAALAAAHERIRALADEWRSARRKALREGAPAEVAAAAETARKKLLDGVRALRGKDLPVLTSWPGKPCAVVGSDRANAGAIALLPRSPLDPDTSYLWWALWTDLSARDEDSPGGRPHRMVEVFTTGAANAR